MSRGKFYFGNANGETLKELIREGHRDSVLGAAKGDEWIAFADNIALYEYSKLFMDKCNDPVTRAMCRIMDADKTARMREGIGRGGETLEGIVRDVKNEVNSRIEESELIGNIVRQINSTTMHEVALHVVGELESLSGKVSCDFSNSGTEKGGDGRFP